MAGESSFEDVFSKIELFVEFLYPGMILKNKLYTEAGDKVHEAMTPITQELINDLHAKKIKKVFYNKPAYSSRFDEAQRIIPAKVLEKAFSVVLETTICAAKKQLLPKEEIESTIEQIMERIYASEGGTFLNLLELKEYDDYTFNHSVNVSIISILFGKQLGWPDEKIKNLGIGAILHDIGKTLINPEIMNKADKLTASEFEIIKKHTIYGYEIIRGQSDYGEDIQKIALLHHERYDGLGYPLCLQGEKIPDLAALVSISDFYDATTTKRPYKKSFPEWLAFLLMHKGVNSKFHPILSVEFINKMPELLTGKSLLSLGSFVVLNGNEIGEIIALPRVESFKPKVRILISNNRALKYPIDIDLELDHSRNLENIITDPEQIQMINNIKNIY
jgi:putative nucleotidyltransferase with HDIG domain